ncbi:MAG: transketolase [Alphaproteobacteria bacterium]|nr:transketolase [Alphaproteobacteria bacterium]
MSASANVSKPATSSQDNHDLKMMSNAIRALAMDAVQKANSGHPGMPMGMADVATVLYAKFLKFNPKDPHWQDRDRFILSAGHGSMLLYALNYLTGYEQMTIEEIKNFRQLHSKTPGHPEVDVDCGIEMTTGPLGQGISTSVGFALGERVLNARFGDDLVDNYTYVIASDGDMQEGISHEACAFAGHQKLSKLIVLYDDNNISIDGDTSLSFSEDVCKRFEAYGWDTQKIDGHDHSAIEEAIEKAKKTDTPSLIACKTKIGFGAPNKEGTSSSHGSPLGDEEIAGTRENLGWTAKAFDVPEDTLKTWRDIGRQHEQEYIDWQERLASSSQKDTFYKAMKKDRSEQVSGLIGKAKEYFGSGKPKMATRQTSGTTLEYLIPCITEMVGGSADLTGSNNTRVKGREVGVSAQDGYKGQYIYYGVREHGMAAIMNGMSLYGGIVPYSGTFLQFADYCRPALRLAALMKTQVIHVMTHDSIGLGEDGPTHQPVEHLAALRAIPNLYTFRPCDGIETAECWEIALNKTESPSVLALTRQGLPTLRENDTANKSAKGAYILKEAKGDVDVTLFASGSEVYLAMEAAEKLGDNVRVVSVPCMELFFEQDGAYIEEITCNKSIKVACEAAIRQGWDALIGAHGGFVGMTGFGDSAPADQLYKHFGITTDAIVEAVKKRTK